MWQRFSRIVPYHAHFLKSGNHAWLALVTLGLGVAVATPLSLMLGVAAYGLGLIFLPDVGPFRRQYDAKRQAELAARTEVDTQAKLRLRTRLLAKLSTEAKRRREAFASLCEELRGKLAESESSSLFGEDSFEKIEDSHLLLLAMEADIRDYLAGAGKTPQTEGKIKEIEEEIELLKKGAKLEEVQQRLLISKEETLRNLRQQQELNQRMSLNLELADSELERLESQLASLKAELISLPASQLSGRLDETLIQVEASQRVLKEGGMVATPDMKTLLGERLSS